jgi:hypothetical protein
VEERDEATEEKRGRRAREASPDLHGGQTVGGGRAAGRPRGGAERWRGGRLRGWRPRRRGGGAAAEQRWPAGGGGAERWRGGGGGRRGGGAAAVK